MKYNQFVNAYQTLTRLSGYALPIREAYKVFRLMKDLQPMYEFGEAKEKQLIEKYRGEIKEDGSIGFIHGDGEKDRAAGVENMRHFIAEIGAMNETEIEGDFTPITLPYDALGEQKITPNELMALDGFVAFE